MLQKRKQQQLGIVLPAAYLDRCIMVAELSKVSIRKWDITEVFGPRPWHEARAKLLE
jgi:hypothetical protein